MPTPVPIPLPAHPPADALLLLVLLVGFYMLDTTRLASCIRAGALQALLIAPLPLMLHPGQHGVHTVILTVGPTLLKALVVPAFLLWTVREANIRHEVEFLLGPRATLLVAGAAVGVAFLLSGHLELGVAVHARFLGPVALSLVFFGLLMLVTHGQAISQVLGYLVLENGVLLFGLGLAGTMPWMVELGILLDVFVAVFIMGIFVNRIQHGFDAGEGQGPRPEGH
jgi:hydrogenase-4 component E